MNKSYMNIFDIEFHSFKSKCLSIKYHWMIQIHFLVNYKAPLPAPNGGQIRDQVNV